MHYIYKIFLASWYSKIVPLLAVILTFFAPIYVLFYAITACVILDLVTGLIKSRKTKIKITSKGLRNTVIKFFLYNIFVGLIFLIEYAIWGSVTTVLSKIAFSLIIMTELLSVCENCDTILGTKTFTLFYGKFKEKINALSTGIRRELSS